MKLIYYLSLFALLTSSCSNNSSPKLLSTKQIVYTADLQNDSAAIALYEHYHSKENVWPEVTNAAQVAGFTKIHIYRFANRLTMILEMPVDADIKKMNLLYGQSSPRLKDWAELTNKLLKAPTGAPENVRWVEMKEVYSFENNSSSNTPK